MFRSAAVSLLRQGLFYRGFAASRAQQVAAKENWDIMAGILVERLPIISRDLTPFEKEYAKMLNDIEFENSMKSDHEIRHEKDLLMAEKLKKGDVEMELDDAVKQTAQDMEDAYVEEFKQFKLAPRRTKDDQTNNISSWYRKLDETLLLLVEQQLGNNKYYLLPQGPRKDGETLRETGQRVLAEQCGDSFQVQFYGNAPVGFYKYKYPSEKRTAQAVGAKVFFFRAALIQNSKPPSADAKPGLEWLTKSEVEQRIAPVSRSYLKSIQQFIL